MYEKLKKFLEFSSKKGLLIPTAYDSVRKEPSTTLLSFYLGLILSIASLIAYHFLPETLVGPTSMTLLFLGMTFVFYRLRNLDKIKFNMEERSIELEDTPENQKDV